MSDLALFGGNPAISQNTEDVFAWPLVDQEGEEAVLEALRSGKMSGWDITQEFEAEFAKWHGMKFGLAANTGTAALHSAMFGVGIGEGDEIICPSITYWASCLQVYSLGGTVVFADVDPATMCLDPNDIEHRITEHTKAIVVVHYCGHPADMDAIMPIARRHNLKVIEDVSHAHGALYKGRMVGTFGDVAGFSLMSGKSFAIGEGGILLTNDETVYQRAVAFGWYERHDSLSIPELKMGAGLPWGGQKYRMHQLSSALGRVQFKRYPAVMAEIDQAMNYFWDLLMYTPGVRAIRPPKDSGSTMGGWYACMGGYCTDELGGLSVGRFCEALCAEGMNTFPGCNAPLHLHPLLNSVDIYSQGRPTRIAHTDRDIRQGPGSLPVAERSGELVFRAPWFKKYKPEIIEAYAEAVKKVVRHYQELLPGDNTEKVESGAWSLSAKI